MFLKWFIISILLLLFPSAVHAKNLHPEKLYQAAWCEKVQGKAEHRLDNGTRVDCLTKDYAIEVDFAHKWYEAIGQSLYYAKKTKLKPGILIIIENEKHREYYRRLKWTVEDLDIKVWHITPDDLTKERIDD